jgi:ABC-2 type transport system ATP-binding protein
MNVIETENLTRNYNGLRAVDGISFAVGESEVFGFLGPNGAGKTTTIRMLTGQLRPTAGSARVAGFDVVKQRAQLKPRIGVVSEQQNLYERMSARANLAFSARLYRVAKPRIDEVLQMVNLQDRAGDRIQKYSNGMKQRLLIARALLHEPQVLFLDEPTRGLDPTMAHEIRVLIADLARNGVTVFLTTHYMDEADQLCRHVAILEKGRIVALDTPERLKTNYGERLVRVHLKDGESLTLALDNAEDGRKMGELAASGQVLRLHTAEATLEEVFIRLTGRSLAE